MKHVTEINGVRVPSFEHRGIEVVNPFLSECGRFEVEPTVYGFKKVEVARKGRERTWRRNLDARWFIVARMLDTEPIMCVIELHKLGPPVGAAVGAEHPVVAVSVPYGQGMLDFEPYVSGL